MIIPLYPCYYCPTAPNNIMGLPAVKHYTKFRSICLEVLSWIRFVDKNGISSRSETCKQKHKEYLLDFFHINIILSSSTIKPTIKAMIGATQLDWIKIHRRYGHPSDSKLAFMCRSKKDPGLPAIFPKKFQTFKELCPICARGKMRVTNKGEVIDTNNYLPGQMLHIDFTFYEIVSIRGFTCVFIIVDAKTRRVWAFCTSSKRPPIHIMRFFLQQLKNIHRPTQFIRCDEGGEVIRCEDFNAMLLKEFNIVMQTTGGYSSWINGKVEPSLCSIVSCHS